MLYKAFKYNQKSHFSDPPLVWEKRNTREELQYGIMPIPHTVAASTFIWGARAVLSSMQAGRRKVYRLFLTDRAAESGDAADSVRKLIAHLAAEARTPKQTVEASFIEHVIRHTLVNARDRDQQIHDGVLLEISALPQRPVTALGAVSLSNGSYSVKLDVQTAEEVAVNGTSNTLTFGGGGARRPVLLWIHGVVDSRNVGAIIRTALFLGVDAVLRSERATGDVTPAAARASAGASEVLDTLVVRDPKTFIEVSQAAGWQFYGAVAPSDDDDRASDRSGKRPDVLDARSMIESPAWTSPCVLVLGNEDLGLPRWMKKLLSRHITITGSPAAAQHGVNSLNVSVAGAILAEKFLRARPPSIDSGVVIGTGRAGEVRARADGQSPPPGSKLF